MDSLPIASSVLSRGTSEASTVGSSVKRPLPSDTDLPQPSAAPSSRRILGTAGANFRGKPSRSRSRSQVWQEAPLDPSNALPCVSLPAGNDTVFAHVFAVFAVFAQRPSVHT